MSSNKPGTNQLDAPHADQLKVAIDEIASDSEGRARLHLLREAYYQAAEAIDKLVKETERCDLLAATMSSRNLQGIDAPMLSEHAIACELAELIDRSDLGKVL
jgi:hypothetical protein